MKSGISNIRCLWEEKQEKKLHSPFPLLAELLGQHALRKTIDGDRYVLDRSEVDSSNEHRRRSGDGIGRERLSGPLGSHEGTGDHHCASSVGFAYSNWLPASILSSYSEQLQPHTHTHCSCLLLISILSTSSSDCFATHPWLTTNQV